MALVSTGLVVPLLAVKVVLIIAGVAVLLALPWWADRRLDALEQQWSEVSPSRATSLLSSLGERRLVAMFAPHAWVQFQRARLLLALDDPRGASRALSEAVRLNGGKVDPSVRGLWAHTLLLGNDRRAAKEILLGLEAERALGGRERTDLGMLLMEERAHQGRAIELLESARREDGGVRATAALAFAYGRAHRHGEAEEALKRAEEQLGDEEPAQEVADLLRRAKKLVRQTRSTSSTPAANKRERRKRDGAAPQASTNAATTTSQDRGRSSKKKQRRQDTRKAKQARPEKDRAARPSPTAAPVSVKAGPPTLSVPELRQAPEDPSMQAKPVPPKVVAPVVAGVTTLKPVLDDPWAELVAGDDEEVRPA